MGHYRGRDNLNRRRRMRSRARRGFFRLFPGQTVKQVDARIRAFLKQDAERLVAELAGRVERELLYGIPVNPDLRGDTTMRPLREPQAHLNKVQEQVNDANALMRDQEEP